jgi:adenylate cyclase
MAGKLARRAVELDDNDPWAYMALGFLAWVGRQTNEAVRQFRAALDLNPNFAAAHGWVGWTLVVDGQTEQGLEHLEQAMRMSPRDPLNGFFFAGISAGHYLAGRYDEAVNNARQAVQLRPEIMGGHRILCASLRRRDKSRKRRPRWLCSGSCIRAFPSPGSGSRCRTRLARWSSSLRECARPD